MSAAASELLFSYGTLQLPAVQLETFGRLLEGTPDALPGHQLERIAIDDPEVVRLSGETHHLIIRPTDDPAARVPGVVFAITAAELARADAYETADYARVRVVLASGTAAWVYAAR